MNKVVLVNPPNDRIVLRDMYSSTISKGSYNWPNADLLVLSGLLRQKYEVVIIDANALGLRFKDAVEQIAGHKPIGICCSVGASVRNDDYRFIQMLKRKLPRVKIIGTGGILYHNAAEELQRLPELDACLLNFTTDDIVKYFASDFEELCNVTYRERGKIRETPLKDAPNGFAYDVPLHSQLPIRRYQLSHGRNTPMTSVLTSFGCPGRCGFCVAGRINYRYRDPDNVIEELKFLNNLGVKEICFRDNVFCASKKQGRRLLTMMAENNFSFSWVADTRANVITNETASLMKAAGCHALHIGVESSSQGTLDKYGKDLKLDQIKDAFRICRENGILTVGYFILGLPGETRNDVLRTIDLAIMLDCDYASFNIPIPIYGTDLRRQVIDDDFIDGDPSFYDGSSMPKIRTSQLAPEDILEMRNLAYKKFYFRLKYIKKSLLRIRTFFQCKMLFLEFYSMCKNRLGNKNIHSASSLTQAITECECALEDNKATDSV